MKIGFSSLACPGWDLDTIVKQAATLGFQGVELRGLRGDLNLPLVPDLARHPDRVRALFAEQQVELVCLGSSASLTAKKAADRHQNLRIVTEFAELAGRLGCPFVRVFVGETSRWDNHPAALARSGDALMQMVSVAVRNQVTLVVENGGDFAGSADLWYLVDAVGHPNVRCCWSQFNAATLRERATTSIPRLGNKIALVHLSDGDFGDSGALAAHKPLGAGRVEIGRQIELLRGLAYNRYLIFESPKLWVESLPEPGTALPAAAAFLKAKLAEKQAVLSAYKGDKNAPKLASAIPA